MAWPPLYGRAASNDLPTIAGEVVMRHNGFAIVGGMKAANTFELRLVAAR